MARIETARCDGGVRWRISREAWAWAFYDWAKKPFSMVISSFVIAAYFVQGIAPDPTAGQVSWGWMQALSGVVIALSSPVLGAIGDAGGRGRLLLLICTTMTAGAAALLWFARPDPSWSLWALGCIGFGTVGFELATVFYNAMLPEVAPAGRLGLVSGVAWGIGYVGGLTCLLATLFALVMPEPSPFGLDRDAAEHIRASGPLVAGWIMLFGLPALRALPGPARRQLSWCEAARSGLVKLRGLLRTLPRNPGLARFLLARLFYTDGLNTLFAFGAIYAAGAFGMSVEEVVVFGIVLSISGAAGAAAFGPVDDWIGSKWTVVMSLVALIALGAGLLIATSKVIFWMLASMLGIVAGPTQAASRTLMAHLAPPQEEGAYFGLFALSGRVTGFTGPAVLAAVTAATHSQRAGIATVLLFLGVGAALLLTVPESPQIPDVNRKRRGDVNNMVR